MKKVIGLMMVLVMVFVFMANSIAETNECDCSFCKAERFIKLYAKENGYEKCDAGVVEGDVHYRCGILVQHDWTDHYGYEFTLENWAQKCIEEYNCIEFTIQELESFEGRGLTVYYLEARTANNQFDYEPDGVTTIKAVFTII